MADMPKVYYWRGKVASSEQAVKVVKTTGGWVAVFAALGALSLFSNPAPGTAIGIAILGITSLALFRAYNLWAARFLFGLSIFGTIAALAFFANGLWEHQPAFAGFGVGLAVLYGFFVLATRRTCEAARFLRDQRRLSGPAVVA